jgi:ATP-dependent exoDNAse (exonuclease V) alpha subunit
MEFQLTQDQQRIFDLVQSTDSNYWILGKPGVGKSVLIRALTEYGEKHFTLAAPTGLAAINIGGKTLHSIFGIPVSQGIFAKDFSRFTTNPNINKHVAFGIKALIIDEVSMVRADTLDYIDRFMRHCKGVDLPFGGIQVICVGDFFQLPPIINKEDRDAMKAGGWQSEFAFDAFATKDFKPLVLEEVLRQKGDDKFIDILHAARTGNVGPKHLVALNKQVQPCTDYRVRLTGRNRDADEINQAHLKAIKETSKEFSADSFGDWPEFPAATILELKIGAQVLIKKNAADRVPGSKGPNQSKVVNGSLGIVVELPEQEDGQPAKVMVKLQDGSVVSIYRARWERKVKEQKDGEWSERLLASFEQIPLQLAWAISMHKSQGQSFDAVHVNAQSIFAAGQLYVALSRCRSLAGLSLETPVSSNKFWANVRVKQFTKQIEAITV